MAQLRLTPGPHGNRIPFLHCETFLAPMALAAACRRILHIHPHAQVILLRAMAQRRRQLLLALRVRGAECRVARIAFRFHFANLVMYYNVLYGVLSTSLR